MALAVLLRDLLGFSVWDVMLVCALGAGALATIGPISLKDWGNLTWSWVSTFDDFVLETAVISPGTNLLATVFHSPFDLGQWLKFEWTSSIQGKTFDFEVSAVPLPPALLLFGSAMAGIGFLSRKRKKAEPSLV